MNLRHLEIFYAIMRTGSISEAARKLNVSQPSVSAVLRHAEQSLKIELFERVRGRLKPTPEAHTLLPEVEEIFEKIELVDQVVREIRSGRTRELVVASSQTLANTILARAVSRFRNERPQTNVSIQSMATEQVIDRIVRREADIGLVYGSELPGMVKFEHLISSAIVCAFKASHPLSKKTSITCEDLEGESIISIGPTTVVRRTIDRSCRAAGIEPPHVNIEASSSFAGCLMVSEGAGVALIDQSTFLSDFFRQLSFRPFEPACSVDIALVLPLKRRVSPPAGCLATILHELTTLKIKPIREER